MSLKSGFIIIYHQVLLDILETRELHDNCPVHHSVGQEQSSMTKNMGLSASIPYSNLFCRIITNRVPV